MGDERRGLRVIRRGGERQHRRGEQQPGIAAGQAQRQHPKGIEQESQRQHRAPGTAPVGDVADHRLEGGRDAAGGKGQDATLEIAEAERRAEGRQERRQRLSIQIVERMGGRKGQQPRADRPLGAGGCRGDGRWRGCVPGRRPCGRRRLIHEGNDSGRAAAAVLLPGAAAGTLEWS